MQILAESYMLRICSWKEYFPSFPEIQTQISYITTVLQCSLHNLAYASYSNNILDNVEQEFSTVIRDKSAWVV